ncbi:hypothetical protein I3760_15G058700 [Carya illinoinensis]|nr:hypothetical protein I3760_15G058700 [Carya illinoinensis]
MRIFLQAQGREIWKCIVNGPYIPTKVVGGVKVKKEEEEFDREDDRLYTLNLTAMNLLYNALNGNEFNRIMNCATAKEIWDNLEVTYEGTSQVKKSKIYILTHEYEMFKMNDDESISTILEARDLKKLEVNELIGSLITHEYTLKRGEEEGKPKKSLALKAVPHESESDEDEENDDKDEEPDCPLLKKDRNKGKKAMKATWDDDSSSSDSEASNEESANLCLMAKDDIEVTNLDNIENPSYENCKMF